MKVVGTLEELLQTCIGAGKPGGGTFLANCHPHGAVGIGAGGRSKVNGWGPDFADDRCVARCPARPAVRILAAERTSTGNSMIMAVTFLSPPVL